MITIGLDESGTGSICSIFTVCAFMMPAEAEEELRRLGVNDSKKLSDAKRREIYEELAAVRGCLARVEKAGPLFKDGHQNAWREAIAQAAKYCLERCDGKARILIDGSLDATLLDYFDRVWGIRAEFYPGADAKFIAVGAASIVAKTVRNDHMIEVGARYPQYGFEKHMGYGTPDHMDAIAEHGICPEHRRVRPLEAYFTKVEDL